jgi:hypothetical protein
VSVRLLPLVIVAVIVGLAIPASAWAQTYTVSNLTDSGVAGDGSLRGEVKAANANPGPDKIEFAPGLSGLILISGSGFVIQEALDIEGPGADQITIEQNAANHRVFLIELGELGAVTLAGLTIRGGDSEGPGGDIENVPGPTSTLTISDCRVIYGYAAENGGGIGSVAQPLIVRSSVIGENESGGSGGGIWAGGNAPLRIEGSSVEGNISAFGGGGLYGGTEAGGGIAITGSTFARNHAFLAGGGANLSIGAGSQLAVANSTFFGNVTGTWGGALALATNGTATIEGSTFTGNQAEANFNGGGGLESFGPNPPQLTDTIVAGNKSLHTPTQDLGGSWNSAFSLIGDPTGATLTETVPGSDLIGVDPGLTPLADNGGPTETMALPPSSPAVNKGGGSLTSDQRGDPRPSIFPGVALSAVPGANGADIGAFELQAPAVPAQSPPATATAPTTARRGPQVRLKCPKSAKPGGCRFAVQAVSAKPRESGKGRHRHLVPPKPESTVARIKLAAGKSAPVTLTPNPRYAARLAAARQLLVREVETIRGVTHTSYPRLKVVG